MQFFCPPSLISQLIFTKFVTQMAPSKMLVHRNWAWQTPEMQFFVHSALISWSILTKFSTKMAPGKTDRLGWVCRVGSVRSGQSIGSIALFYDVSHFYCIKSFFYFYNTCKNAFLITIKSVRNILDVDLFKFRIKLVKFVRKCKSIFFGHFSLEGLRIAPTAFKKLWISYFWHFLHFLDPLLFNL